MAACAPLAFGNLFVDDADCRKKNAIFWAGQFFGGDSGATLAGIEQCGAELDVSGCNAWWIFNYAAGAGACERTGVSVCESQRIFTFGDGPASCFPKGPRNVGEACGAGAQCQSGICRFTQAPGNACGLCMATIDSGPCPDPYVCTGPQICANGTCASIAAFEPCGSCAPNLLCALGACKPAPSDGKPCDPTYEVSRAICEPGHVCNATTHVCEPAVAQKLGAKCGALEGGGFGTCELGARCTPDKAPNQATCVTEIPLGAPCGTSVLYGSACAYPGDCVAGTCQIRGPALCR